MTSGHTQEASEIHSYRKTVETHREKLFICKVWRMVSGEPILDNTFILDFQPMQPPGFGLIKALSLGSVRMAASAEEPRHKGTRESFWGSSRREGGVEGVKERQHDHITLTVPRSFSAYSNSVLVEDAPLIVAPWWVSHNGLEIMIKAQD